jgi:hypothetical protein
MTGFDASDKIIDISAYMHANHINLYSFERPEPTLSRRKMIIQIESLHVEILTIKVKS